MKNWMFIVIVLLFVFVVVPLIYFGIVAASIAKVESKTTNGWSYSENGNKVV